MSKNAEFRNVCRPVKVFLFFRSQVRLRAPMVIHGPVNWERQSDRAIRFSLQRGREYREERMAVYRM